MQLLRQVQHREGSEIFFGHLYESFAHQVLSRGGTFKYRDLENHKIGKFHLKPKSRKLLHNQHSLIGVGVDEYGAGHNTFPAIDAITVNPSALFNMTVAHNRRRGLTETLEPILDALPPSFPLPRPFFWVVPSAMFSTFQKQSATHLRSAVLSGKLHQYVLEVPIEEPAPFVRDNIPSGGIICTAILKSGKRKGEMCGSVACGNHQV